MGDFVQSTNVKTAVRALASPIADVTAFNTIVQSVITGNPFACVAYTSGSASHEPVEKTRETYVAKFVYRTSTQRSGASGRTSFDSVAGYNAGIPVLEAVAALNTAHNGTPAHDAREGHVLGNTQVPGPERRDLQPRPQPGQRASHVLHGRGDQDEGRDLGRLGGGARIIRRLFRSGAGRTRAIRVRLLTSCFRGFSMETELVGIILGAVLPIYPLLFVIYQKIGKYDEIVEEFKELRKEHQKFREGYHGS